MGLFSRNWAGEAMAKAANALAGFRYSTKEMTEEEKLAKEEAKEKSLEEKEAAKRGRKDLRAKRKTKSDAGSLGEEDIQEHEGFEEGGVVETTDEELIEAAHKVYTDEATMFGRDRKIANDWAYQLSDESFIEGMVSSDAGEQEYIQLVEMLAQFIEMSKKYFRENYGTPEDPMEKGTFMSAYKRYKSGKNVYEPKGVKDAMPWQAYEQSLMGLESSDVSFRIESGVPTISRKGVIMPLAEDQRNPQPFMLQLAQIQQPESNIG